MHQLLSDSVAEIFDRIHLHISVCMYVSRFSAVKDLGVLNIFRRTALLPHGLGFQ